MKNIILTILFSFGLLNLSNLYSMGYSYIEPSYIQKQAFEKAQELHKHIQSKGDNFKSIKKEYDDLLGFVKKNYNDIANYSDIAEYVSCVIYYAESLKLQK